jgi:dGTPase
MANMIESALSAFTANYDAIMAGDYRGELLGDGDAGVRDGLARAKQLAKTRVFPDTRKTELEVGAYSSLGVLLEAFCRAVHDQHSRGPERLGYRSGKIISLMGIHAPSPQLPLYHAYRRALDFIGGMTDNYATYLARQVGGLNP